MNIPAIFAAIYSAIKTVAILFLLIFAIGTIAVLIAVVFAMIPLLNATNVTDECPQQKETNLTIGLLPSSNRKRERLHNQTKPIQNEVLITPPSDEDLLIYSFFHEPEALEIHAKRDIQPLNNQLATQLICWQVTSEVSKKLGEIKASELKSIASELQIPKYRNMNKTQLLLAITEAFDNAPAFSQ